MSISVFDLFSVGIGPSSSHTVGPMRAARRFAEDLVGAGAPQNLATVKAELFGSLGLTGKGHGSGKAVLLGLEGDTPETVDVDSIPARLQAIESTSTLRLMGQRAVPFKVRTDVVYHRRKSLPGHPNGMRFTALDADGKALVAREFYSVGGGFIVDEDGIARDHIDEDTVAVEHPFLTGSDLLDRCDESGLQISTLMFANEQTWRSRADVEADLIALWDTMQDCITRGCAREGILPGGLKVRRRAAAMYRRLRSDPRGTSDPLLAMDWVNLWALAVNEENAAGGRIVTAPTNGAAGIIPAVLKYYMNFHPHADDEGVCRFLLAAGAIGLIYKRTASISGAEVGCQGEVGVACSMAAAGLTEVCGGTPRQVENAAEIGMEHNLGLTCDPVGGLVQVPCIERNAMGAIKAINASRLALRGDGGHKVSLDTVIATMRETGRDMSHKYKETARGGLAVNVVEC